MKKDKLKAVFYARVSTEEEKQLNAIEKQIEENREVIEKMGWLLVDEYIDRGITGTQAKKRNEYMRLLEDIKKGKFDVIVAKDQTRLQRNTMDWYIFLNELLANEKKLYLYLENTFFDSKDKFIFGIKAMMAEEYSRELSRKGNAAKTRRQEKGKPIITNRTWGYRNVNGEILIDEKEAGMIRRIYRLFADGYGGRVVSRMLREDGIRNRNGKTLSENTIRDIVKNPMYKGVVVMNKEHFDFETKRTHKNPEKDWIYREGLVPAIIDDELWEKANSRLNSRKTVDRTHNVGINKGNTMLSSKIICGECGAKYWRNQRKQGIYWYCSEGARTGSLRPRVATPTNPSPNCKPKTVCNQPANQRHQRCASLNLKEDELLSLIEQLGKRLFGSGGIDNAELDAILTKAIDHIYACLIHADGVESVADIEAKKQKLQEEKERLLDFLLQGTVTESDYTAKCGRIEKELTELAEKEEKMRQNGEKKEELYRRLNEVRTLFADKKEKGIEVPLMNAHIERIVVHENRLDIHLDFLSQLRMMSVDCSRNGRKISYDFADPDVYEMPMRLPTLPS